jgi:hypothetical protein
MLGRKKAHAQQTAADPATLVSGPYDGTALQNQIPGATAQFLVDPANPGIITLPAPGEQQPDKTDE